MTTKGIIEFEGLHRNQSALIVLGGDSGSNWKKLWNTGKYDFIIGVSGTIGIVEPMSYWLNYEPHDTICTDGDSRLKKIVALQAGRKNNAVKMVFPTNVRLYDKDEIVVPIMREWRYDFREFNPRKYDQGLLVGKPFAIKKNPSFQLIYHIGTVASAVLHLACLLGCTKVGTIGLDLCYSNENKHHWYDYPTYREYHDFGDEMFTEFLGRKTLWWWVFSAYFLFDLALLLHNHGCDWNDYSGGLLCEIEGLWGDGYRVSRSLE